MKAESHTDLCASSVAAHGTLWLHAAQPESWIAPSQLMDAQARILAGLGSANSFRLWGASMDTATAQPAVVIWQ